MFAGCDGSDKIQSLGIACSENGSPKDDRLFLDLNGTDVSLKSRLIDAAS
jgi:hypothetical protein